MRKSRLVQACSILMMLMAIVRLVFGIMMINFFSTALTFGAVSKELMRLAGVTAWVLILHALVLAICGFQGAVNWDEPMAAKKCVFWGAAALILGLAGNFLQAMTGYGVSYVAWTTGAVVPGLFLLAALYFARNVKIYDLSDQKPPMQNVNEGDGSYGNDH